MLLPVKVVIILSIFDLGNTVSLLSMSILNLNSLQGSYVADWVLFTHIGLHIPVGVGVILGDFNICDPEEGRFNVWNQTFTNGDPGKNAVFHSFFPYVLEVAQSDYTRRDATALGVIRTLSRIDRIFINLSWLRHVISTARLMLWRTLGRKLFRVTMLQYASSSRNLLVEDTTTNVSPVGCPNIPFLVLSCNNL